MEIGLIQIVTLPIIFVSTFTRSTVGFGDASGRLKAGFKDVSLFDQKDRYSILSK